MFCDPLVCGRKEGDSVVRDVERKERGGLAEVCPSFFRCGGAWVENVGAVVWRAMFVLAPRSVVMLVAASYLARERILGDFPLA